jgi:predicted TPR repeat methyltransferase
VTTFESSERHVDAVIASSVLEYLSDPIRVLVAFRDRLNPGGRMYVSVPNQQSWVRRVEQLGRFLAELFPIWCCPRRLQPYRQYLLLSRHRYSETSFRELVEQHGMQVVACDYLYQEQPNASGWRKWTSPMLFFVVEQA